MWFSFVVIFLPLLPESKYFLRDLAVRPRLLAPENLSDGYISPTQFYNHFHDGMAAPYLKNPTYIIIVDFRYFFWKLIQIKENHHGGLSTRYKYPAELKVGNPGFVYVALELNLISIVKVRYFVAGLKRNMIRLTFWLPSTTPSFVTGGGHGSFRRCWKSFLS